MIIYYIINKLKMCDLDLRCWKCRVKNIKVVYKIEVYLKYKCVIELYLVDSQDLLYYYKNYLMIN